MTIQREFALFCDDVRQEISGKYLLIGTYGDHMVVSSFPIGLTISAFLVSDKVRPGSTLDVQYRLESGGLLGQLKVVVDSASPVDTLAMLPLPPIPLGLSSPDTVSLWLSIGGEDYRCLAELRVVQGSVNVGSNQEIFS